MEVGKRKCSSGYSKPPWIFRGRALYQLHLVKAETARACIPKEFRLVEAFGYTLGGFFLASYDDSPAGVFDELVVIAGIVWNRPTSCAWAAKVLVNSVEACNHGRKEVGLPSRVAKFSKFQKIITETPRHRKSNGGFLNLIGMNSTLQSKEDQLNVQVCEVKSATATDVCNINLSTHVPLNKWMGPEIKMSLPSYSGHTEHTPDLLKYSCQIQCRVRAVEPAKVSVLSTNEMDESVAEKIDDDKRNLSLSVMLSKPFLAFEMSSMKMQVEAPRVVSHFFKQKSVRA